MIVVDWGMIGAVAVVVGLVLTVVGFYVAWRSERRKRHEREEASKAERARVEAERTAARLAIVALVRRLDEHQILSPETDHLDVFYGSPAPMITSAKSIRDELLEAENTLRKAESILGESYEYDIASLQKMGESCKNFLGVLERLALREDLTFGGQDYYDEVDGPHSDFRAIFETEIEQLAERNGIKRSIYA